MASITLSFLILSLIVASATAQENETTTENYDLNGTTIETMGNEENSANVTSFSATTNISTTTQNISTTITPINITSIPSTTSNSTNSTMKPSTTMRKDDGKLSMPSTTSKPLITTKGLSTTKNNKRTDSKAASNSNSTGIIIIIVIIIIAALFVIACYLARRRGRRYSVDPTSRAEEVNIPLSTVEPAEAPADTFFQNGLQTFESTEPEPEAKSEEQKEQKAEADKSVVETSAEPAPAPSPTPDSSGDKPKEAVVEQSPPAPVEQSVEEKTDDKGLVSNKTLVESLKETNENNSNNADLTARGLKSSNMFWDVPLDCPCVSDPVLFLRN